jgi:hypothetical protein
MGDLDEGLDLLLLLKKLSKNCKGSAEERRTCNGKKQIPFGNDRKKSKGKGKGRSRFPSGMTERKATATATAKARMQGSLPCGGKKRRLRSRGQMVVFRQVLRKGGDESGFRPYFNYKDLNLRLCQHF